MPGLFRHPPQPQQRVRRVMPSSAYASLIVSTPGLRAYWRMGEASGNLIDSFGPNDAVPTGTLTRDATGAIAASSDDGAIVFGGGKAVAPDHATLDLANTFSIEAWFRRDGGDGTSRWILSKNTGAYELLLSSGTNKLTLQASGVDGIVESSGVITDSNVHHVVATRTTGAAKIWLDGVDVSVSIVDVVCVDNALDLDIGGQGAGGRWNGLLDEVALYSVVLDGTTILAHYNLGTATAGPTTYNATPSDTVTAANTVARVGSFLRATADTATAADAVARVGTFLRATADTVTAADTVARVGTFLRAVPDTVTAGNAVARVGTFLRTTADSVTAANTVTRVGTFLRSNGLYRDTFTRTETDSWGTADVGGPWIFVSGTASEFDVDGSKGTISVSSLATEYNQRLTAQASDFDVSVKVSTDKATTGDSQQAFVQARHNGTTSYRVVVDFAADDSVSLRLDASGVGIAGPTTISGLTHAANTAFRVRFQVQESTIRARIWLDGTTEHSTWDISVTDTSVTGAGSVQLGAWVGASTANAPITVSFDELAGSGDGLSVSAAVAAVKIKVATLADSVAIANTVARVGTFLRTTADTVTAADTLARVGTFLRSLADSVTVSDTLARVLTAPRALADSVTVADTLARVGTFLRSLADSVTLSDAATGLRVKVVTIADAVSVSAAVARVATNLRATADSVTLTNTVDRVGTFLRTTADSVSVANAVAAVKIKVVSIADSVTASDAVTRTGTFLRTLADTATVSAAVDRAATKARSMADSVSVAQTVARTKIAARSISDTVTAADSVTRIGTFLRGLADATGISELVSRVITNFTNRGDVSSYDVLVNGVTTSNAIVDDAESDDAGVGGVTGSDSL